MTSTQYYRPPSSDAEQEEHLHRLIEFVSEFPARTEFHHNVGGPKVWVNLGGLPERLSADRAPDVRKQAVADFKKKVVTLAHVLTPSRQKQVRSALDKWTFTGFDSEEGVA